MSQKQNDWLAGVTLFTCKNIMIFQIKLILYSEKATNFFEIFTLLLTVCTVGEDFSEYMNFTPASFEFMKSLVKFNQKVSYKNVYLSKIEYFIVK